MPSTPPTSSDRREREGSPLSEAERQEFEEIIRRGVQRGDYRTLSDELDIHVQKILRPERRPRSGVSSLPQKEPAERL